MSEQIKENINALLYLQSQMLKKMNAPGHIVELPVEITTKHQLSESVKSAVQSAADMGYATAVKDMVDACNSILLHMQREVTNAKVQ